MKSLLLMRFTVCSGSVFAYVLARLYETSKGDLRILLLPAPPVLLKSEVDDYFVRVLEQQAKNVNLVLDENALSDHYAVSRSAKKAGVSAVYNPTREMSFSSWIAKLCLGSYFNISG